MTASAWTAPSGRLSVELGRVALARGLDGDRVPHRPSDFATVEQAWLCTHLAVWREDGMLFPSDEEVLFREFCGVQASAEILARRGFLEETTEERMRAELAAIRALVIA